MRIDAKSARAPRRDETFAGVERCSRSSATRGGATAVAERLRFRRWFGRRRWQVRQDSCTPICCRFGRRRTRRPCSC